MFTKWKAKLGFPTLREYRRPRRFGFFTILQHTLIDLSGGQIECDEPLVLGMDHPSKELIPIVQIPPHKGKHLCEEDLAGNLLGLAPAGTGSAPGAGISVLCPARADRQNLTLLVDQHLYWSDTIKPHTQVI